jgi:DNA mismatch repair protein MutS2
LGLPPALVDDARSRLSRAQVEFESTLASIKASQLQIEEARAHAAEAEARAREARRVAEDERRRARQERDQAVAAARVEAEEAVAAVQAEIAEARRLLARETLTERGLDEAMARLEARLSAVPMPRGTAGERPAAPGEWRVGMRAGSTAGWTGTIAAIDRDRGRVTLDAGGLRVEVPLDGLLRPDEMPVRPGGGGSGRGTDPRDIPVAGRRGDFGREPDVRLSPAAAGVGARRPTPAAARAIPSSLDVRGARVDETIELLESYLDRAATAGAGRVTIIHGHGSGALRDAIRGVLAKHPLVRDWRPGDKGEGGDGATVVML